MSVWRVSLLLAALLLAMLVAAPLACGVALPDGLPVGNPEELEVDQLGEPLDLADDGEASLVQEDLDPVEVQDPEVDPIELAGAFEGDILLASEEQRRLINDSLVSGQSASARNAIRDTTKRWPNAVIPYTISGVFNGQERAFIAAAMREYHMKTCIKFMPRTNQRSYIRIIRGQGCSSHVGRQGGAQQVSLGQGCLRGKGTAIHEFMHAAGFWHEHSRYDRDNYVRINWNNILRGMAYNFNKYSWNEINLLGEPYDLSSIMHYNSKAFSKNGHNTIDVIKPNSTAVIGQTSGLSTTDIRKLNKLYSCTPLTATTTTAGPTTGFGCADNHKNCAYWARIGECSKNPAYMHAYCKKSCNKC